jgi:hypothetical protein
LSYPDAWYFAGGIAEFLMKRLFLFCSLLPEFVGVGHGPPIGRLRAAYSYPDPSRSSEAILVAVSCELGFRMRIYPPPVAYPSGAGLQR